MDAKLPFILALLGAIVTLGSGAMMGLMSLLMGGVGHAPAFAVVLLGALSLFGVAGGGIMLAAALRMRHPPGHDGASLAIVGGCLAVLGGNILGAALGIVAGVLAQESKPAPAG
jgi:hypothetical protein